MATVTKKLPRSNQFDGAPYGNAVKHHFKLATNAAGGAVDAEGRCHSCPRMDQVATSEPCCRNLAPRPPDLWLAGATI